MPMLWNVKAQNVSHLLPYNIWMVKAASTMQVLTSICMCLGSIKDIAAVWIKVLFLAIDSHAHVC